MSTDLDITKKRPATVEYMLEHAMEPISDTANYLGISVEETMVKYSRLYTDRNWMSALMRFQHRLIEMEDLLSLAKDQLKTVANATEFATVYRAIQGGEKLIMEQIAQAKKGTEAEVNQVTLYQARVMSAAISLAMERSVFELQKLYPELDPVDVQNVFNESLPLAVKELEGAEQ